MLIDTKSVVIASEDLTIINQLTSHFLNNDYTIIIEKSTTKSIRKILEQQIDFIIFDLESSKNSILDLIKISKITRPRLPIVVLSNDNSLKTLRSLAENGVFYCALKPLHVEQIDHVIEAIKRFMERNGNIKNPLSEYVEKRGLSENI